MEILIILLFIFLPVFFFLWAYNHKKKEELRVLKKKTEEELRLEKIEKHKNEFNETISTVEITPEIFELRYKKNDNIQVKVGNYKNIKKDKIYTYDVNEIVFYFESLPLKMSFMAKEKTCIHWHITLPSEKINDLLYDMTLATIYVGETTIEQFQDELEKKKIEEQLIKERRRKELVKIVKKEMEDEE